MRELLLPAIAILATINGLSSEALQIPATCPQVGLPNKAVYLAHETDCTKFYKCLRGEKYLMVCPEYSSGQRLYFDPAKQVCVWPEQLTYKSNAKGCTENNVQIHPYNCGLYYKCENDNWTLEKCNVGEMFDSVQMKCTPEEQAHCEVYVDDSPSKELVEHVFLPHECKCSMYYESINGKLVERFCPPGRAFDQTHRTCVLASHVDCQEESDEDDRNKCPSVGVKYIPHETDCDSYYECVDGVKNEKLCENGLSFDEVTTMCTWSSSIVCASRSNATVGSTVLPSRNTIVDTETAEQCPSKGEHMLAHECYRTVYYKCVDGVQYRESCPNDMIFDDTKGVCNYPEAAVCNNRKMECLREGQHLPHETNCSLYYTCHGGNKYISSCLQGHYFNEVIESCDLPSNTNCFDGFMSTTPRITDDCPASSGSSQCICRIRDTKNCSRYYECHGIGKVSMDCPNGLQYDPVKQICDWPNNVNCSTAPKVCEENHRMKHECQCKSYYVCDAYARWVKQDCPYGQLFDPKKRVCDYEENVDCEGSLVSDVNCIGTCPSSDDTQKLPHKDCHKYCVCNKGIATAEQCAPKKVYNERTQICQWPENVRNLKCDPFVCDSNSTGHKLPHECFCDRYYVCEKDGTKIREMCANGKEFDYEREECVYAGYAHCYHNKEGAESRRCKDTCQNHNPLIPIAHEDCTKYCKCERGGRVVYECNNGLYYDVDRGVCDWPENIKHPQCELFPCPPDSNATIPHECNCTIYYSCCRGNKYRETCEHGYHYDYVAKTCVLQDPHCYRELSEVDNLEIEHCVGICPARNATYPIVRLPHADCSKYCGCSLGAAYIINCPEGLHYNRQLQICTSPQTAGCEWNMENESVSSNSFSTNELFPDADINI